MTEERNISPRDEALDSLPPTGNTSESSGNYEQDQDDANFRNAAQCSQSKQYTERKNLNE